MGHLPLITECKQFTSQPDEKQGNQKFCVLLLTPKRSKIYYLQMTSRPHTFWKAVQSDGRARTRWKSWFYSHTSTDVLHSGFWITLSLFYLSQKYTYICHSFFFFPQVAHSRAMPISALSLLYPGALTQAPAFTPLVVHSSRSCWTETGTSTCLRRERMMLCSLPLPVEISWLLQPIFSDARCAALLIDKNCYINFKVITICQNYRSTGLQP